MKFTFDEKAWKWNSQREIYWKDKSTHIDVYAYYPYLSVDNVSSLPFEIAADQSTSASEDGLGGYEASDFLWGKAENVAPTDATINVVFSHRMAGIRVSLAEGSGFAEGEWISLDKQVLVLGTKRNAVIDLATGTVSASGEVNPVGITPQSSGSDWRAVAVPQEIAAGTNIIRVTVGGYAYKLTKSEAFTLVAGKQHNFTVKVNKRAAGNLEFTLSRESITAWENDPTSHDATAREYVVINVDTPGTLDSCIAKAGRDLSEIRNLKLKGTISAVDFEVMNTQMTRLRVINLREVRIAAYDIYPADGIPDNAFSEKTSLVSLVLPDTLKIIGENAFSGCHSLVGALNIPEGVENIKANAFFDCYSITSLTLPSTLKVIGNPLGYSEYWSGAFSNCAALNGDLILPEGLETIGSGTFYGCKNLTGTLKLPSSLKTMGKGAFQGCSGFKGNLEVPQGVTEIPQHCFADCAFQGNLVLHEGIEVIGNEAFANAGLKGELYLPSGLVGIQNGTFKGNDFTGVLVIPSGVSFIGEYAFSGNWRLSGTIEFPKGLLSIGSYAFNSCNDIEGIVLGDELETIQNGAFNDCSGLNRIVCQGSEPPVVYDGAFDGVSKDNFTVEVPGTALQLYKAASGWKDFKRISSYRNLVPDPSTASAINTLVSRTFTLYADDEWEIFSQPDWVTLNPTSGTGKTEMTLTFDALTSGSETRTGEVVFNLKDQDYTASLSVSQYNYEYTEDEILTLQSATKGKGVNLMFLADGYDAKEVSAGEELNDIRTAVENFFAIEPYKTYRDYFNVYTGVTVSPESGIGSVNTIVYNRFNTSAKGGVTLGGVNGESDMTAILQYACKAPTISEDNLAQTLVVMIPNTTDYGGICYMYDNGCAIAYCPMSDYGYPLDFRGVVQHEAGGHGFGKLGDEYIYHNEFIDNCPCSCCNHVKEFNVAKANGWYDNLSLNGKTNEVPWSNLIYHEKYRDIVDIYEGGYMHNRGVYRSEYNSCMNKDIPYYSSVSKESIVRRIKEYAGEEFSFDDFVANDKFEVDSETGTATVKSLTKSNAYEVSYPGGYPQHHEPVLLGDMPEL